ncbi:MAG: PLP-dependent aspartate aminotransferase family protein [Chloroflexota bacterium]|nr:PLP-dependent aspartate aminotransferase family protein [Chloroflexota bacterium]
MHTFETRCVHAGEAPDPTTGAHGVPIYQNVTYAFETFGQVEAMRSGERPHFSYSPRGNPTVRCLEAKIANLEGAEATVALNSGMAAISGAILAVVGNGGHIVASDHVYDLTHDLLRDELPRFGAAATFVDINDASAIASAITPETRAIYAEPVSNPLLRVTDIEMVAGVAREHGLPLIVDNTFLSPAILRPLEHGATVVIHSATKYLSGNGQVQGGVVSGPRDVVQRVINQMQILGTAMPAFSAWLILAGSHTLALRMARHSENAQSLAELLVAHPAVAEVNYPGLACHPRHDVAVGLFGDSGFGGMVSFRLRRPEDQGPFLNQLQLFTIAVSLGDTSSLAWPWANSDLIRISAGLEAPRDLVQDVRAALDALPES